MSEKTNEWLVASIKRNLKPMADSTMFVQLFSGGVEEDPNAVLQLGMAMMLDKPIALVVLDGVKVPKNIEKVAIAIERVSRDDPEMARKASEKIAEIVRKYANKVEK